ncbi:MAG: SDR family oxidoreductase [Pseudomonadales bacterium]
MAQHTAESVTEGVDLTGQYALVTGVNSGIGLETARVLALRGATVLGTARTLEKAQQACSGISGTMIPLACELTDQASVRQCAEQIVAAGVDSLDMVIANAGIMALPNLELVDGIEKQFATNHLGHFLLINLLLPKIGQQRPARVVVVSSAAHMQAPKVGIEFDNLAGDKGYSSFRAYGQSKLANVLFANELAKRVPRGTTVNSLHPGIIRTNLGRNMRGPLVWLMGLTMWPFMISVARGAATSCFVAANPAAADKTGRYFANCEEKKPSPLATDEALRARLWTVSEQLVGLS